MPIQFEINARASYFSAKYTGPITLDEIISAHEAFFQGGQWHPRLNALVDIAEADFLETSNDTIHAVAQFFENVLVSSHAAGIKTAIYAPSDFPYGLARVYEAMASLSPQTVEVFRKLDAAIKWLETRDADQME